mmetsp:Transcript_2895/g.18084  ORF Transcript_2895/g.18084 Transcript_2895/m.18084 type:complete len:210 (+) Transcript_2895:1549-2178(+)
MARAVFPLFVLAREGGGDLVGRRRPCRNIGAASQCFANGKHHHWHQETYTTHEAGPHDDGFFVHHLCVSRRGGRVRSVPLLFRSSQVGWTTTVCRFHPSTGLFCFFAAVLADACADCWYHVRDGFSRCISFFSRSDPSSRAFVPFSRHDVRATVDPSTKPRRFRRVWCLLLRLYTFVLRHCFRAGSIRVNVACSLSSFAHLVEPLLGCR